MSGIFYSMGTLCLNSQILRLALAALTLMAVMAVACNGDDSEPDGGSPSPVGSPRPSPNPSVTPGVGDSPAVAVGRYIDAYGLDGHQLDLSQEAQCPLEAVQTVTAGTATITSTIAMGQFCLASKDWVPDKAITVIIILPGTDEAWEMKLDFDNEISLWKVKDVEKTSG